MVSGAHPVKAHKCPELVDPLAYCGHCARAEEAAENRRYSYERDLGMSDLEVSRLERWLDSQWT